MRISGVKVGEINIPLLTPFKTALRTVSAISDVVIRIETDTESCGYGEAPPTAAITGDTKASIKSAILDVIAPAIIGMEIDNIEGVMRKANGLLVHNASAKAAVDMAVYDLYGKLYGAPLYKLLGGYRNELKTDLTISANNICEMVADSVKAVENGYDILKIKLGKGGLGDIEKVAEIRAAVGKDVIIRIDANQGWLPKESVRIIRKLEDLGLDIELVEQPVKASDKKGLKFVTDNVLTPILADEAVFSLFDAAELITNRTADLINVKLMKTGGIYNALKICGIAEEYGVGCMMGSMLESRLSVGAAAHLACAKSAFDYVDLDGPGLCCGDPFHGGPEFVKNVIRMTEAPGIGFANLDFIAWGND